MRTETITNENLEILFCVRFRNGKANRFPQIFSRICFCNDHHIGNTQAITTAHTYEIYLNPEAQMLFRFRFRNSTERKSKILGFIIYSLAIVSVGDAPEQFKSRYV